MTQIIDPKQYTKTVDALRLFFSSRGFLEVHTQNRLSILAACEDPTNVTTYNYANQVWPLPQTGQMWLEYELLKDPKQQGFYCISTSYRQEPNPVPGRHDLIFPMFEFEFPGNITNLEAMERELCEFMGFGKVTGKEYSEWCWNYKTDVLDDTHEMKMHEDYGASLIRNFPNHTSPFWNMARNDDNYTSKKIDVILGGMETIGSAERSTDIDQMRDTFHTISEGKYASLLYDLFGKDRVEKELDEFLEHDFIERVGGGIGVTRMISALNKCEIVLGA